MSDSPLDMRMDQTAELTASKVINQYSEQALAGIIYEYGEERFSRQIAKEICNRRKKKQITTTKELVEIIKETIPFYDKNAGHPATRKYDKTGNSVPKTRRKIVCDYFSFIRR